MKKNKLQKNYGFTVIEMIVSLAVFFFIVGVAVSIFISIVKNQKIIMAEQHLVSQISYLKEYMSKAIRMAGFNASCNGSDLIYLLTKPTSQNEASKYYGIKFFNQSGGDSGYCQEFYWDTVENVLKEVKDDGEPVALTSSDIKINDIIFSINGGNGTVGGQDGCSDNPNFCGAKKNTYSNFTEPQPKVTIVFDITAEGADTFNKIIQTTISQRNLNVPE